MAQETKVGLLIGLALILLVGLVLSDLFTGPAPESAEASSAATEFGREAQAGIYEETDPVRPSPANPLDRTPGNTPGGLPGFAAEPAQPYGTPGTSPGQTPPRESWSPLVPATPSSPSRPGLTVEPPLPELDTLEARDSVARFNDSLEAMRLAVQNPVDVDPDSDLLGTLPTTPEAATDQISAAETATVGGTTYIHYVQAGQTLTDIARQHYGNPEFARAIALTNPTKVDREGQARAGARLEIPPLGSPVFSRLFEPVHAEHAVRVDQTIPDLPNRPDGPTAMVPATTASRTIEVQPGDTLSELAAEHLGSSRRWQELIDANRDQLDSAASLRSGMTLRLPTDQPIGVAETPSPSPARNVTSASEQERPDTYTVRAGDNLTRIAERLLGNGERWDELLAANANQLDRPENLQVGMKLKLPTTSGPSTTPRNTTSSDRPASAATTLGATTTPVKTYTVQAGDNLTRIAEAKLGDGDRWRELFEANADQLRSPNDLFAGQTLRLP